MVHRLNNMYWKNVQLSQFYLPNSLCLIFKFLFIVPLWYVNLSRKKYLIEASSVSGEEVHSSVDPLYCTSQTPNSSVGRHAWPPSLGRPEAGKASLLS